MEFPDRSGKEPFHLRRGTLAVQQEPLNVNKNHTVAHWCGCSDQWPSAVLITMRLRPRNILIKKNPWGNEVFYVIVREKQEFHATYFAFELQHLLFQIHDWHISMQSSYTARHTGNKCLSSKLSLCLKKKQKYKTKLQGKKIYSFKKDTTKINLWYYLIFSKK